MTTTLQEKLRRIFLAAGEDSAANDIFSNIISTITNIFHSFISWFNEQFPPESRDEQIRRWTTGATPYLTVACVLIMLLCCWCCLFPCITSILSCLFQCVYSILSSVYHAVVSVFRCLCCCGSRSRGGMMKAPGRPKMKLSRSGFENNPRGYFRDLRGKSNNFVQ